MSCFACITGHLIHGCEEKQLLVVATQPQKASVTATLGFPNDDGDDVLRNGHRNGPSSRASSSHKLPAEKVHMSIPLKARSPHRRSEESDKTEPSAVVRPVLLEQHRPKRGAPLAQATGDADAEARAANGTTSPSKLVSVSLTPASPKGRNNVLTYSSTPPAVLRRENTREQHTPKSPNTPKIMVLTCDGIVETSTNNLDVSCMDIPIELTSSPHGKLGLLGEEGSNALLSGEIDTLSRCYHPAVSLAPATELDKIPSDAGSCGVLGISAITERSIEGAGSMRVQAAGDQLHKISQATTASHGSGNGGQKQKNTRPDGKAASHGETMVGRNGENHNHGQHRSESAETTLRPTGSDTSAQLNSAPDPERSLISRIAADVRMLELFEGPSPDRQVSPPVSSTICKQLLEDPVQDSHGYWGLWC